MYSTTAVALRLSIMSNHMLLPVPPLSQAQAPTQWTGARAAYLSVL